MYINQNNSSQHFRSQVCLAIVDTAFANPVLPSSAPAVPEEVRDASRVACNASVVHQADRMLRDLVGKKMREFRESTSEADEDKDAVQVRVVLMFSLVTVLVWPTHVAEKVA